MATNAENQARRVASLCAFYEANKKALGNPRQWSIASGVSYNSLNEPLSGAKTPNLKIHTLECLAEGASRLLNRPVTIDELIGRTAAVPEIDTAAEALFKLMTPEQMAAAINKLVERLAKAKGNDRQ